ncbi:MAG: hypothetical protein ABEJ40_05355 [Haloarculaceae archaeon]
MTERDLTERLDAVERTLTDGDADLGEVRDAAALAERVEELEDRADALEETVEELDAAVEAVRGYAGNVRAVNRDVERRASAALAKVEALETALDEADSTPREMGGHLQEETDREGPGTAGGDRQRPGDPGESGRPRDAGREPEATAAPGRRGADAAAVPGDHEPGARPGRDRTGTGGQDARSDSSNGTEAFIERVRDAL